MQWEPQHKQLVAMLPPKQQTLDFAKSQLWEQLPESDRRSCRDALAHLLCQAIQPTQDTDDHE
jgi:hypothetical protein